MITANYFGDTVDLCCTQFLRPPFLMSESSDDAGLVTGSEEERV